MIDSTTIVAALPVTTSDSLRLTFWNPSADVSYNCFLRYLLKLKDGSLMQGSELLAVTAPAAAQEFRMRLTDGELLWCSVDCGASTVQDGALFVAIALQSGDVDQASNLIQLTSGYVATGKPVNYPLSEPSAANDGPGAVIATTIPDPAVGNPVSIVFPATADIEILSAYVEFEADANVANRLIYLTAADAVGTSINTATNAVVTAAETVTVFFNQNPAPIFPPAGTRYGTIPPTPLTAGANGSISAQNIQVGDIFFTAHIRYRMHAIA